MHFGSAVNMPYDPVNPMEIATKNYVDTRTPKITVDTVAPSSPAVGDVWIDAN
jgi:hypothetical protein